MTYISRRDLLFKAIPTAKRPLYLGGQAEEVVIGRVSAFPLGEKKLLAEEQIYIESLPEGLRAQSTENENQFFSIKTNQFGELVVNRAEIWSAATVFSVMTNGPSCLDISEEDRS